MAQDIGDGYRDSVERRFGRLQELQGQVNTTQLPRTSATWEEELAKIRAQESGQS